MINKQDQEKETIFNSPAPNELSVVKTGSEWPKNLIKLFLVLLVLIGAIYYLTK